MRLVKSMLLIVLLTNACVSFGQYRAPLHAGVDAGAGGLANKSFAPSLLYYEGIGLPKSNWLQIMLGVRAWGYYANRTDLHTKTDNPQDYLQYRTVANTGLSFAAGASIRFRSLEVGVNTDLAGVSFGTKRHGYYDKSITGSPGLGAPFYNQWVATAPVIFNVAPAFLKNYNGQSEAFARIFLTDRLGIKIGYVYGQVAYVTKNQDGVKVLLDNRQRRFSDTYGIPYLALTIPILN